MGQGARGHRGPFPHGTSGEGVTGGRFSEFERSCVAPFEICKDASCQTRPLTESLWALRLATPFNGNSPGARRIAR
eukprot:8015930-Pyramimonas_sp.AAC.1